MREILFRGQTRKYGEKVNISTGEKLPGRWVYGGIFPGIGDYSIIYGGETEEELEKHVVYSDTVGQYTGMTDMNGNRIFEGDIWSCLGYTGVILWSQEEGTYVLANDILYECSLTKRKAAVIKIIGNIYDSPELLERKGGNTE